LIRCLKQLPLQCSSALLWGHFSRNSFTLVYSH